jgi:predicted CXXCH cytochrome family protein
VPGLSRFAYLLLSFALLCGMWSALPSGSAPQAMQAAGTGETHDPNAECAQCHRAIYERYRTTPMANASGPAAAGFIAADFTHAASGIHYTISEENEQVWLSYTRHDDARPLDGRVELKYFLGSGRRGRTYLFEQEGYWFEAPINWYAKKRLWDMTPHFLNTTEMPLTLPVDQGCLHCHATGASEALPDARNHYAAEPFAAGGVTCTACHGDATAHVQSGGKVKMTDLDALEPVRRDSICLNCHLEGEVMVEQPGKELREYSPGDDLFDYALFFVYKSEDPSGGRATSQWEALLKSACKKQSGDRMTCTTCHDPHGDPSPAERVEYYRAKCLACHNTAGFAETHHLENRDCTQCHMARPPSNDIAHEQVTDHWIRREVSDKRLPLAMRGELETVGGLPASARDLGLAYAQMAARGDRAAGERALVLLQTAEKESSGGDHELHAQRGFLEQMKGDTDAAAAEYRGALAEDNYDALAAGDLALIEAQQHNTREAERLWQQVFDHDPVQLGAGMNLAAMECANGEHNAAERTLERVLVFAPDDGKAHAMLNSIESRTVRCGIE